jgi:hypothetical protein
MPPIPSPAERPHDAPMTIPRAIEEVLAEMKCIRVLMDAIADDERELRADLYRRFGELRIAGALLSEAARQVQEGR